MPLSYRLAAFYFLFFAGAGLWVAYLPPYFAARGLGAAEIAWVLALPQLARIVAPTAWASLADRFGAQRALVVGLMLPTPDVHAAASGPLVINSAALLLLASAFFMAVAHGTLYAFFTLHLQRLGYEGSLIGFLWMLGVLGEIGVFLFLPAFFRRFDLSTILVASAACGVARFLAIGWAADWLVVLLVAQLLHAATLRSVHAASVAAIQRIFPPQAQARGQSLFSSIGYGAGGALGAVAAGWAWEAAGPGFAFTVSSVAAAAGLLFAYPLGRKGLWGAHGKQIGYFARGRRTRGPARDGRNGPEK